MGLCNLQDPYSPATWYENQGAYDLNAGTDLLLDQTRQILASDAYIYQGVAFPKGQDILLKPGESFSGTLNLVPYSYLLSMTSWNSNTQANPSNNIFAIRIYDKGAQSDLYYGQFAWSPTVISNMAFGYNNGFFVAYAPDRPFGPYFFRDPLIILPPGVLQIQLSNVGNPAASGAANLVQMLFGMAVPKTTLSMQNRKIITPADQSGLASVIPDWQRR